MPTINCAYKRYHSNLDNHQDRIYVDGGSADFLATFPACLGASNSSNSFRTDTTQGGQHYLQSIFNGANGNVDITRKGIFFDTSAVLSNWIIDSAILHLWLGTAHWGSGYFHADWIKIVSAPALVYPLSAPSDVAEYGYLYGCHNVIYSQYMDTDNFDPVLTDMAIPSAYLSDIIAGGISGFGVRQGVDFAGNIPGSAPLYYYDMFTGIYLGFKNSLNAGTPAYLEINYHLPSANNIVSMPRSIPAICVSF